LKSEVVYINAYIANKKGDVCIAGNEVFFLNGRPPDGACGTGEDRNGALIGKLNSNGKTIWAKVIDADE